MAADVKGVRGGDLRLSDSRLRHLDVRSDNVEPVCSAFSAALKVSGVQLVRQSGYVWRSQQECSFLYLESRTEQKVLPHSGSNKD